MASAAADTESLLFDAQDALFEGRNSDAASLATEYIEAISKSPSSTPIALSDGYAVLFSSLFHAGNFKQSLVVANQWMSSSSSSVTSSIVSMLKAAYFAEDSIAVSEAAIRLQSARGISDGIRALGRALAADMPVAGVDVDDCLRVKATEKKTQTEEDDDVSSTTRMLLLNSWTRIRRGDDEAPSDLPTLLEESLSDVKAGDIYQVSNAGLAAAMLAILSLDMHINGNNDPLAQLSAIISEAPALVDEPNIAGAQALCLCYSAPIVDDNIRKLILLSNSANELVKGRTIALERKSLQLQKLDIVNS